MSIVLPRARGSSVPAISFRAPEEAQRGKYSFRNAATQTELAECARPAAASVLPAAEMATLCIDGSKKAKCPGDIFRRAGPAILD